MNVWTPFILNNGRITNIPAENSLNIININDFNKQNNVNTVSQSISDNNLNKVYFSNENIENIQKAIIDKVYIKGNYRINKQSYQELKIIMRSIYLQYSKNNNDNINSQITYLNNLVIEWSVNEIIKNIKQQDSYIESISSLPIPMERSNLPSQKGTRTLEIKSYI